MKQKEQMVHEEDEQGNILVYPAWSKKKGPRDIAEQVGSSHIHVRGHWF